MEDPMTLDDFVSQGWRDHATDAEGVLARLPEAAGIATELRHLPAIAGLTVHVAGEHLGRWVRGIEVLENLERLPFFDPSTAEGKAVLRSKAVLHRCAGNADEEARWFAAARSGGDIPEDSDRVRVLAVAAAALLGQKRLAEASRDFEEAVRLASYGPTKADPAARALAVTGHNLACELETTEALTDPERALMLRAAAVSRTFWEIAGGWMETERAEYRLAMSHVKAGNSSEALTHAQECLRIVAENGMDPGEAFFAHEAIARAQIAGGNLAAAMEARGTMEACLPRIADESFRIYCAGELAKLAEKIERT
jgi:hypothetical protein